MKSTRANAFFSQSRASPYPKNKLTFECIHLHRAAANADASRAWRRRRRLLGIWPRGARGKPEEKWVFDDYPAGSRSKRWGCLQEGAHGLAAFTHIRFLFIVVVHTLTRSLTHALTNALILHLNCPTIPTKTHREMHFVRSRLPRALSFPGSSKLGLQPCGFPDGKYYKTTTGLTVTIPYFLINSLWRKMYH